MADFHPAKCGCVKLWHDHVQHQTDEQTDDGYAEERGYHNSGGHHELVVHVRLETRCTL